MSSEMHLRRPTGSIIGRSDEVRTVGAGLDRGRLVSLVGSGGVGKTALAAEVAHEVEPEFDRIVVVELVTVEDRAGMLRQLSSAVLETMEDTPIRLAAALDGLSTLLVIDNCEHLVGQAADVVRDLLDRTTSLQILVTSRRPLNLADEIIVTVQPLAVPAGHSTDAELTSAPAIQLFLERVRQAVPNFELTETNRPLVAQICQAADGVPLVLELAAALVRSRPLDEILLAMNERPTMLQAPHRDRSVHQQTLGTSLDWSRRFLMPEDATLLDRLSVFADGFTTEGARLVGGEGPESSGPDGLSNLVDHSLVHFDVQTGRYRLLEVVRADADHRLSSEERSEAARRHLQWCLLIVDRIAEARFEADPEHRFPLFDRDLSNICVAAKRCLEAGDLKGFRRLIGPIAVWLVHYVPPDRPEIWSTAFDVPDDPDDPGDLDSEVPLAWRANIDSALSFYWSHRGRHERALAFAQRAEPRHAEAADAAGWVLAMLAVGNARLALGNPDAARSEYERALEAALAGGQRYPELLTRLVLARIAAPAEAKGHLLLALPLAEAGFVSLEALVNVELGLLAKADGDLQAAAEFCEKGLALAQAHGYVEALATAQCARAEVAMASGDTTLAGALFDEAQRLAQASFHEGILERVRTGQASLSESSQPTADRQSNMDRSTRDRPSMLRTQSQSGYEAQPGDESQRGYEELSGDESQRGYEELSDRELAVARLLRGDLTQREIAEELYVAPSTVKTHIKAIYRKLGVSKRSHAITRATELALFD